MTPFTPWIVAALIAGAYLLLRPLEDPEPNGGPNLTWPSGGGAGGGDTPPAQDTPADDTTTDPPFSIDHSDDIVGEVFDDDPPTQYERHDPRHPEYDATRASDFGEVVPDAPGTWFRVRGHPYCKTGEPAVADGVWPVVHGYDCDMSKPRNYFDAYTNTVHAQWPPSHLAPIRQASYEATYGKPFPDSE